MSNYILKYSRDERVKYISHLDFIRMFHRAVRRSGVDFLYSEGFNPHPKMTVAIPLSVGVTSDGEYMKVGFCDTFSCDEIKSKINTSLPPGFKIIDVIQLKEKEVDLTKINKCRYIVSVETTPKSDVSVEKLLENNEIIVLKKTKSGEKPSDIRPYIYELEIVSHNENIFVFNMLLSCGNEYNLKPETVVSAMEKYSGNFSSTFISVHRKELLFSKN